MCRSPQARLLPAPTSGQGQATKGSAAAYAVFYEVNSPYEQKYFFLIN